MRVSHALRASVAGLGFGYAAALVSAFSLRLFASDAGVVWNLISPLKLGAWILTSAHAVPLVVRSAAGISAPEAAGSVGRLSELLGGGRDVAFSFSVVLVPLSILAIVGATVALLMRRSPIRSGRDVLVASGLAAGVHGGALAIAAWSASIDLTFEGTLAPDLGLGAASGRLDLRIGHSPIVALVIGAAFGGAFAAAGGMASLNVRATLAPQTRVVLLGWLRGVGTAAALIASVLAIGAIVALISGRSPSLGLFALGGYLLAANAVAAGILLVHGGSMAIALDAGPFTGWERMNFLNFGVSGSGAPRALLLGVVIPIVSGVVAGRFCRRRTELSTSRIAVRLALLWGLTLAVLALLLRVRVLSSFSVGELQLGGGSAAFDPLAALLLGFALALVTSYFGALTLPRTTEIESVRAELSSLASGVQGAPATWDCSHCGFPNATEDAFCVSCGSRR